MDITPLVPANKNLIQAYASSYIVIKGEKYMLPIVISPDQIISEFDISNPFLKLNNPAEIFLIGNKDNSFLVDLEEIKAEVMSFGAACRTYNVLLTEGREVACFLI